MPAILMLVTQVVGMLPALISAGQNVAGLISSARAVIAEHGTADDPRWAELEARITEAQSQSGGLRDTSSDVR
jgi:hypothetical protein